MSADLYCLMYVVVILTVSCKVSLGALKGAFIKNALLLLFLIEYTVGLVLKTCLTNL